RPRSPPTPRCPRRCSPHRPRSAPAGPGGTGPGGPLLSRPGSQLSVRTDRCRRRRPTPPSRPRRHATAKVVRGARRPRRGRRSWGATPPAVSPVEGYPADRRSYAPRVTWGPDRLRIGKWRGRQDVAVLTPWPGVPAPPASVLRASRELERRGVRQVLTPALRPAEQEPFLELGFEVRERLHLLRHPLDRIPEAPDAS